jgi:hypothetical protein
MVTEEPTPWNSDPLMPGNNENPGPDMFHCYPFPKYRFPYTPDSPGTSLPSAIGVISPIFSPPREDQIYLEHIIHSAHHYNVWNAKIF